MSFAAPFSLLFAIVIPCWIAAQGIALKRIATGAALVGIAGLAFLLRDPPTDALSTSVGLLGKVGILMMVIALVAGITLAFLGIIQQMSGKSKR